MILIPILADHRLDLAQLAARYSDAGDIFLQGPYLTVQNDDGLWFCIDASRTDADFDGYPPVEVTQIHALVGRPIEALIECSDPDSINLALSRFPNEEIFVINEYSIVFTIQEIQRRIEAKEDWQKIGKEFL